MGLDLRDPRIGMVAGETSGDLLAGLLLKALRQRWPALESFGMGGPRMADQGFEAWWPHDLLALHGYSIEVLRKVWGLLRLRRELGDRLLADKPDVFIGVDAPDFNLGLEARLKREGVRTIHFVSPSIWAWRGERIHKIRESVDHVLCLFPFEPEIYERAGISATYVGHPLADAIDVAVPRAQARQALGLGASSTVVALLPGSRRGEIEYIGPRLLGAAALLKARRPELEFVLPAVPRLRAMVQQQCARYAPEVGVQVLEGRSHEALAACDLTLIASGTATLEAALFKRPMVVAYNMHPLSWWRMRRMAYQPWVGLPNILLREFAVPELLQQDCTPEALARESEAWLDDPSRCELVQQKFTDLHLQLRQDTAKRATDAIVRFLGR